MLSHLRLISCHVTSLSWQELEEELNELLLMKLANGRICFMVLPMLSLFHSDKIISLCKTGGSVLYQTSKTIQILGVCSRSSFVGLSTNPHHKLRS